jgi:hypothetical protein
MKTYLSIFIFVFFFISCGRNESKLKEQNIDSLEINPPTAILKDDSNLRVTESLAYKDTVNEISDTIKSITQNQNYITSDFFEIALIDYHKDYLLRIFVVIDPEKAYDTSMIRQTICLLKYSYPLDKKSNISFFSEKKYANYKTELFMRGEHLLPMKEYRNWMDSYYLGEYDFMTNYYRAFPSSSKSVKQKTYRLKSCNSNN